MSHFCVLVCLPADTPLPELESRLDAVMAPWDENRRVEPYRRYEEGAAEDHWWVSSIRQGAGNHTTLTEIGVDAYVERLVADLLAIGRDWRKDLRTEVRTLIAKHAPDWAEDAEWVAKLPDPVTWDAVVELYNAKFHPRHALAVPGEAADDGNDDRLHYDRQTGQAFTWSTYNPDSKWDYWSIGGRWGGYFVATQPGPGLITGARCWDSPDEPGDQVLRCDGGPKVLLDFDTMREAAARQANERYDRWDAICADTPVAKPWSHFVGLVNAKAMDIDTARTLYRAQPRIQKAQATHLDTGWDGCVVEEFLPDRDEYVAQARAAAVPGYALVTLDGHWLAPGRMGWFGMSSDGPDERHAYEIAASRYLDNLQDNDLVVVLDCHI